MRRWTPLSTISSFAHRLVRYIQRRGPPSSETTCLSGGGCSRRLVQALDLDGIRRAEPMTSERSISPSAVALMLRAVARLSTSATPSTCRSRSCESCDLDECGPCEDIVGDNGDDVHLVIAERGAGHPRSICQAGDWRSTSVPTELSMRQLRARPRTPRARATTTMTRRA